MSDRRWMLFLDGENFTLRAQDFAMAHRLTLQAGPFYEPGVFIRMPTAIPERFPTYCRHERNPDAVPHDLMETLQPEGIRAYYYTSAVGSDEMLRAVKGALWELGFAPNVFKKDKATSKTKGVDITLTKDVLSHAFLDNYDAVFLVAGDADYVPLVEEVKRRGKIVYLASSLTAPRWA